VVSRRSRRGERRGGLCVRRFPRRPRRHQLTTAGPADTIGTRFPNKNNRCAP
jgi:hypothetical protein